jgi:protocatechuate 3,4-dioxygenase beta subunit
VEITARGFTKQTITLNLQDRTTPPALSITLRIGNQPDEERCGSRASIIYGSLGESNSQLSGTVHDYMHGQALRNAEVTIRKAGDPKAAFESHSDASGRFKFENLPPGPYDLRIVKAGYRPVNIKHLIKPKENGLTIHATILEQNKMVACQ